MTTYEKPTVRPDAGRYFGFHHVTLWVGNAKQASLFYQVRLGLKPCAYRGLETGERQVACHVVKNGNFFFEFQSPLNPEGEIADVMNAHLKRHGDGVRDVAFKVSDCRAMFAKAVKQGARVIKEPMEYSDEHGTVIMATVATYGDTVHTLIQGSETYKSCFLPGYSPSCPVDAIEALSEPITFEIIDHCVGNQPNNEMVKVADFYSETLDFHRFWSVDDKQMHTEYSALRSIVMADFDEVIKMPINEPAPGKKKSQIQEYVEYYGGAGVQHIALKTHDIIHTVTQLRKRGTEFLEVPDSYYNTLEKRLANSNTKVKEDMATLRKLKILVDFDECGYLLQLFTKPLEDRPTLFIELIQRANHEGFGAGNFKSLFEAIELEQGVRGNL